MADELEYCTKNLHVMFERNIMWRPAGRGYVSRCCRACYNDRMKTYMQQYRKNKAANIVAPKAEAVPG